MSNNISKQIELHGELWGELVDYFNKSITIAHNELEKTSTTHERYIELRGRIKAFKHMKNLQAVNSDYNID